MRKRTRSPRIIAGSVIILFLTAASAFAFQEQARVVTGIVGLESLDMSGKSYIDSYDSSARGGYKASKSKDAIVVTNGQISFSGGSGVDGHAVSTRSGLALSGGSRITGVVSYSTLIASSGGSVTTEALRQTLPQLSARAPGGCEGYPPAPAGPDAWIKGNFIYDAVHGDLIVAGANVTVRGGTYCLNNIDLSGGSSLNVDGPVAIHLNGSINLSAGSVINRSGRPSSVEISSASARGGLSLSGHSEASMTVIAPRWSTSLSGGSNLFGSVVTQTIAASGDSALHFDTSLANYVIP